AGPDRHGDGADPHALEGRGAPPHGEPGEHVGRAADAPLARDGGAGPMSAPTGWARRLRRLLPYAAVAIAGVAGVIALKTRPVEATIARVETGPVVREAVGTGTIESEAQVSLAFT